MVIQVAEDLFLIPDVVARCEDVHAPIEEFIRNGAPVKLIREEFSMPGRARNVGVRNSGNDWIAFTDAGNRVERDWLATAFTKVPKALRLGCRAERSEPVQVRRTKLAPIQISSMSAEAKTRCSAAR